MFYANLWPLYEAFRGVDGSVAANSRRPMLDVLNLALPFFGLIFLGLICGKLKLGIPETGLAWMGFFLIYLALPCLFYRVLAQTPLEEMSNPRFIAGTVARDRHRVRARLRYRLGVPAQHGARPRSPGFPAPTAISATWGPGLRSQRWARPRTCRSR